jgi:hypothetical protein
MIRCKVKSLFFLHSEAVSCKETHVLRTHSDVGRANTESLRPMAEKNWRGSPYCWQIKMKEVILLLQCSVRHYLTSCMLHAVTNMTIARQWFGKHVPGQRIDTEYSIAGQGFGKHVPAATNKRGIFHCWAMVP